MLIKPATSHTLTQCWYTRTHNPVSGKWRDQEGALHSTCRHCQRAIKSQGGKSWILSDGVDLDELASHSSIRYISVTNVADGMVIKRYPIALDAGEEVIKALLGEVLVKHGISEGNGVLDVRVMGGSRI